MTAPRRQEFEQQLIDHEVRVSRVREAGEMYAAGRDERRDSRSSLADRRWYRGELISMLAAARTEAELDGLGLSDEVVREAGLGDSLLQAWARYGPAHLGGRPPPPGGGGRAAFGLGGGGGGGGVLGGGGGGGGPAGAPPPPPPPPRSSPSRAGADAARAAGAD
jgi:hypothetical protein